MTAFMRRFQRRHWVLGVLGAVSAGCLEEQDSASAAGRIKIAPSATATDEIQQALDEGLIVELAAAQYELTKSLSIPSGGRMYGAGRGATTLVVGWSAPASAADDPRNAAIIARAPKLGEPLPLAASATKDSLYLAVDDAAELPLGWLRVRAANSGADEYEMSDGADVVLTEIVRAAAHDPNGIILDTPTRQFHRVGAEVQEIVPVEDIVLAGFDLHSEGGTIASGILLAGVVGATVDDVSGAGFSRALIELGAGTRWVSLTHVWSRGENNALLLAESAMDVSLASFGSSPDGLRCHALGVPRALLTFRSRCTAIRVTDGDLARGCVGIRTWGGHHVHFSGITIRDMFNEQAMLRDPEVTSYRCGVGIDMGAGALPIAEFAYDVTFEDVHLENCRHPVEHHVAAWYLHDVMGVTVSNCSISNKGESPWQPGRFMAGLLASDCMGTIESLTVRGVIRAVHTINNLALLRIANLDVFGSPGSGIVGAYGLLLEHTGIGGGPRVDRFSAENVVAIFATGHEFTPDWTFSVGDYRSGDTEAADLILAQSIESTPLESGDVVELQTGPNGERQVAVGAGASTKSAVVVTGSPGSFGLGHMLICPAPVSRCTVLCTDAAVEIGDLMVASSTPRRAEANNDPSNPFHVLGKALTAKPAGAQGRVLLGPA